MLEQLNHKLKTVGLLVLPLTVSLLTACANDSAPDKTDSEVVEAQQPKALISNQTDEQIKPMVETQTHTGTIVYKNIEGGFYAFEGKDGSRFTLSGIKKAYQKHGLIVEITGVADPDIMTTTQYGTVFKLESIKIIDDSKVRPAPGDHPES